jgi:hypothetical protein
MTIEEDNVKRFHTVNIKGPDGGLLEFEWDYNLGQVEVTSIGKSSKKAYDEFTKGLKAFR